MINFITSDMRDRLNELVGAKVAVEAIGMDFDKLHANYHNIQLHHSRHQEVYAKFHEAGVVIPQGVFIEVYEGAEGDFTELTDAACAEALGNREEGIYLVSINWSRCKDMVDVEFKDIIRHELVHIDQIQRGDLKVVNGDVIWKGVNYGKEVAAVVSTLANPTPEAAARYVDFPWEAEAFGIDKDYGIRKFLIEAICGR